MSKRTQDYKEWLYERLRQDPVEVAAYLQAHLDGDPEDTDEEYLSLLVLAVKDVIAALEKK